MVNPLCGVEPAGVLSAVADPDRLAVVERTGLQGGADSTFDRFARLASALLGAPVSFVTIVGSDGQDLPGAWRGDDSGHGTRHMPLEESFCQFSVVTGERLVIDDARRDPLVQRMDPVTRDGVAAYAGYPLRTPDGHVLGSLCVIDHQPRDWSQEQLALLKELADVVLQEVEHRHTRRALADAHEVGARLSTALGGVDDALKGLAATAEQHDDLRVPRYADLALARLREVLDLAAGLEQDAPPPLPEAAGSATVDLRDVVDRAVRSTRLITRTESLEVELGTAPAPVRGDPVELERAIGHALVAALHHVSDGGTVGVAVGRRGSHASEVGLTISCPSNRVPAAELARVVARLRATSDGEQMAAGEPATIRLVGGRTSAQGGPVTATATSDALEVVAEWQVAA
ncbi:GAF domain-containing protein [Actinomycetospora cinnamomea]|uniref:GAF domain-containing protein n=1 Tax=Actinomycetospora cinnamomea TaxID=663609 RepID=A0A2U1E909_9PSEU|nr:GAF domain-containing protein [Actinomycetospora cinnamomea]PVY96362.1 GAF domain-containing protein [Actinomycetospora cinnamomea]